MEVQRLDKSQNRGISEATAQKRAETPKKKKKEKISSGS